MNAAEGMFRHGQTQDPMGCQTNGAPLPWAEIFSRHEAILASHLEMLDSVKCQIAPNGEAFRTVSSMVTKTMQAINQSKVARKQMLNRMFCPASSNSLHVTIAIFPHMHSTDNDIAIATGKASDDVFTTPHSSSASKMNTDSTSTPQSTDTDTRSRKKRPRTETADTAAQYRPPTPEDNPRASKRRRDPIEGDAKSARYASPGSPETEDISAEVQRRLKIREERRRKKENAKPEKRKRESLASNDGASSAGATHRKKRARRTSSDLKRDGESLANKEPDAKTKRLKKTHAWE